MVNLRRRLAVNGRSRRSTGAAQVTFGGIGTATHTSSRQFHRSQNRRQMPKGKRPITLEFANYRFLRGTCALHLGTRHVGLEGYTKCFLRRCSTNSFRDSSFF